MFPLSVSVWGNRDIFLKDIEQGYTVKDIFWFCLIHWSSILIANNYQTKTNNKNSRLFLSNKLLVLDKYHKEPTSCILMNSFLFNPSAYQHVWHIFANMRLSPQRVYSLVGKTSEQTLKYHSTLYFTPGPNCMMGTEGFARSNGKTL